MARYDRTVPPGGEGKITFGFNVKNQYGKFSKRVMVLTNDLRHSYFELVIQGEISPELSRQPITSDH